jgi:uncharacterized protein (TIGR02246 family)
MSAATNVAHAFVKAINARDPDAIANLLSEDHVFVDSGGRVVKGRDAMREAWLGYLTMVPDYTLTVEETLSSRSLVVLLGTAEGTFTADGELDPENHWETAGAWKAVIRRGKVAEWRVYADNTPIRQVMQRVTLRAQRAPERG